MSCLSELIESNLVYKDNTKKFGENNTINFRIKKIISWILKVKIINFDT